MGEIAYRTLREGEREAFLDLMDVAFVDEDRALFARYLDEDPALGHDDTWVAVVDGRIVSAVQVFTRTVRLRGHAVPLAGLGSVATHPSHAGRGHATALVARALDEMSRRGAVVSLLFSSRTDFYARLGFVRVDHPVLVVRRHADQGGDVGRRFEPGDLTRVAEIYAHYSGPRECTTVRDDGYWRAQLRFAGNPDETFRVVPREGRIVAYARCIPFHGLTRIMEHGCETGDEEALADLLLSLAPADEPLFVPRCDALLESALVRSARSCRVVEFPDQMWRVIDARRLREIAGRSNGSRTRPDESSAANGDDAALLERLVAAPGAVYWPSDRF